MRYTGTMTQREQAQRRAAIKQITALNRNGDSADAEDRLDAENRFLSSCCDYECAGFFFGFMHALRLLKETGNVAL